MPSPNWGCLRQFQCGKSKAHSRRHCPRHDYNTFRQLWAQSARATCPRQTGDACGNSSAARAKPIQGAIAQDMIATRSVSVGHGPERATCPRRTGDACGNSSAARAKPFHGTINQDMVAIHSVSFRAQSGEGHLPSPDWGCLRQFQCGEGKAHSRSHCSRHDYNTFRQLWAQSAEGHLPSPDWTPAAIPVPREQNPFTEPLVKT